jgi:carbonic anhydrase
MYLKSLSAALLVYVSNAATGVYHYDENGADWPKTEGFELCGTGKQQSPIDLSGGTFSDTQEVMLNGKYPDANAVIKIQDHNVQVTAEQGGFTKTFESGSMAEFSSVQFHFHSPSENTIDGKHMDLEMHVVHTPNGSGSNGGVLAFFFDRQEGGSGNNLFIDQVSKVFAKTSKVGTTVTSPVWLQGFLDSVDTDAFWSFDGSLTTPPCTEGIKWTVFKEVQPISEAQLAKFT